MHHGSCLCGAVRFDVAGALPAASACHCSQCRRQSGHYWSSTDVPAAALTLHGGENVTWFRSSPEAERGFCAACGSFLFWRGVEAATISVSMGALAAPTGVRLGSHIYVADKGDYYELTDGLPQHAQGR